MALMLEQKIIESVEEIFSTMVMMDVHPLENSAGQDLESNISSIIGLAGEIRGMVAVHMTRDVALAVTESFLGMRPEDLDDDVKDAVGEIANMVAGGMKIHFSENDIHSELAIPSTIVGKAYRTAGLTGAAAATAFFSCETGIFKVELKYVIAVKNA